MSQKKRILDIPNPLLARIGAIADEAGAETYVVGGFVRDALLGKEVKDIDIVVIGDGIAFAKLAAAKMTKRNVVTFEKFGTAMLQLDTGKVEFVGAREESYQSSSRKPEVKQATLESDLARRDFTVNAIAASLNKATFGEILDPYNGEGDIRKKILRTPLEPDRTFDDDPLRMMRAARFASQLGFHIDAGALAAVTRNAERISIVSMERVTDEFLKILASPRPSVGLKLLQDTGLAKHVFPELVDMVGVE